MVVLRLSFDDLAQPGRIRLGLGACVVAERLIGRGDLGVGDAEVGDDHVLAEVLSILEEP